MKNNIIRLVVVSAFLPMLAFAQTVTDTVSDQIDCAVITHALKLGSRDVNTGGDVTTLQTYLSQANFLESDPTGYFGRATKKAVQDFQRANNITPLGSVGPYTRTKIKEISCTDSNANTTSVNTTPIVNTNTQVVANPSATVNTATNQVITNTNVNNNIVTVVSPNGGETWQKGSNQEINWSLASYGGTLDIYLIPSGSSEKYTIAKGISDGKTYVWNVGLYTIPEKFGSPSSYVNDGTYSIQVCKSETTVCDSSNSYFTIVSQSEVAKTPSISRFTTKIGNAPNSGDVVDVFGTNFSTASEVLLSSSVVVPAKFISPTHISFVVPQNISYGSTMLEVRTHKKNGQYTSSDLSNAVAIIMNSNETNNPYTVAPGNPFIFQMTPSLVREGEIITVYGSGFDSNSIVSIDENGGNVSLVKVDTYTPYSADTAIPYAFLSFTVPTNKVTIGQHYISVLSKNVNGANLVSNKVILTIFK